MRFFDSRPSLNICNNKCPLKQKHEAHFVYFEYYGKLADVNIIFVGAVPDAEGAKYKQPFYPKTYSGKILRQIIKDLDLQNYGIANIVCCRLLIIDTVKLKEKNRTPSEKECDYCVDHLKVFLKYINPKSIVILLGKTAAFSIFKDVKQYIKDNKTITSLIKMPPLIYEGRMFAAAYHPRFIGSGGGINSERYKKYLKRMKEILK